MARFILDIANITKEEAEFFMTELLSKINKPSVISCIDYSNDNQFFEEPILNKLSKTQVKNYTELLQKETPKPQQHGL